jgi:hypothetical protein
MGMILNIVEILDKLTKITQERSLKENKTFKEILEEELKKIKEGEKYER